FFFFQAEDGIRYSSVTGVQTCALPISRTISGPERPAAKMASRTGTRARRARSEERRVGKECRSRWAPYQLKKQKNNNARYQTMGSDGHTASEILVFCAQH